MIPTEEELKEAATLGLMFIDAMRERKPSDLLAEWTGEKYEVVAGVYATLVVAMHGDANKAALFGVLLGVWLGQRKHEPVRPVH